MGTFLPIIEKYNMSFWERKVRGNKKEMVWICFSGEKLKGIGHFSRLMTHSDSQTASVPEAGEGEGCVAGGGGGEGFWSF